MESYSLQFGPSQGAGLLAGFQRLRADGAMCDVVLETGGASFPCHRPLLAASSDYFRALFGERTAERHADRVSIPAVTAAGLGAALDFLYGGWLRLSPVTLPEVLEAARYLQIDVAIAICQRYITDGLCVRTCCRYANLAERHALPEALAAANQAVAVKMWALLQQPDRGGLLGLNVQSLTAVLDSDNMPGVREAELVRLCLDWLDENGPMPLLRSNLLLSRLRFGLVDADDLTALSHSPMHPALATPLIRGHVTRALEYHGLGDARPIRQSRQSTVRASGANHLLLVGGGASRHWPERRPIMALDLRTRKCSSLGCDPIGRLKNHCVCTLGGFLFVIGGDQVTGDEDEDDGGKSVAVVPSNRVWRYDGRFQRWEEAASMRHGRARLACCVLGGVIYALGGRSRAHPETDHDSASVMSSVEFYDMEGGGTWRRATPMPHPLHGHASAVLGDTIYVSGGSGQRGAQESSREACRELFRWEPAGGTSATAWEQRASMSIGRFGHRLVSACGRLYALLGERDPFCDIESYDPAGDLWTRLRPLTLAHTSFGYGMASTPAGMALLCGGTRWREGREVTLRTVMEFDPERDRWREVCKLPGPLTGAECTVMALPL